MATVLLPRSLVELFADVPRRLEVPGDSVAALIAGLDARWPGMTDRLCEAGPRIRPFINVFVDGHRADLATAVAPGSMVHVIPAVAGGCATTSADQSACPGVPCQSRDRADLGGG